eukprot:TRINITY_DN1201_c0_g1_i1.p1 TRINITY_DN1201_c0_g1~~TRINITY_DN1201_c0_g1_i1.p1  ORF type:complete len:178 (+),score=19.73 TRINITY_DN1201_c0_g1_i1:392-925(+)
MMGCTTWNDLYIKRENMLAERGRALKETYQKEEKERKDNQAKITTKRPPSKSSFNRFSTPSFRGMPLPSSSSSSSAPKSGLLGRLNKDSFAKNRIYSKEKIAAMSNRSYIPIKRDPFPLNTTGRTHATFGSGSTSSSGSSGAKLSNNMGNYKGVPEKNRGYRETSYLTPNMNLKREY